MPRYMIERTFPDGLAIPISSEGEKTCRAVDEKNSQHDVRWVHSYVSADRKHTFCIYDAPGPEAIRRAASATDLPVDRITEVRVLDPFFYR